MNARSVFIIFSLIIYHIIYHILIQSANQVVCIPVAAHFVICHMVYLCDKVIYSPAPFECLGA